jgi:hypothetical protein
MYNIYKNPEGEVRRRFLAAVLSLAVTIGVPAIAAVLQPSDEIFAGPTIYNTTSTAEGGTILPELVEPDNGPLPMTAQQEPEPSAAPAPTQAAQTSPTPPLNETIEDNAPTPTTPVGGYGGEPGAPSQDDSATPTP